MQYNLLGNSDLRVSEISFGCMSLKGDTPENVNLLQEALSLGINFFDTADVYDQGENEKLVGKAFKGKRDKVIIATKVGNQLKPNGQGFDWVPSQKHLLESIDKSLQRLQTDYVDLYQLHGGTLEDPIDEIIETFELLKQQGKIRHYGISSIRPNVIHEYVDGSNIVSVMMQYSLLDRRAEETCLDFLKQSSVGVIVRGAVAKGLLVDKEPCNFLDHSGEEVRAAQNIIAGMVTDSRTPSDVAIQYVFNHPAIATAVIGIRTATHLKAALHASSGNRLSEAEIAALQNDIRANFYEHHR